MAILLSRKGDLKTRNNAKSQSQKDITMQGISASNNMTSKYC